MRGGIAIKCLMLVALAVSEVAAQVPGDAIVSYVVPALPPIRRHILAVSPAGIAVTLHSDVFLPHPESRIIAAPFNRGFLFTQEIAHTSKRHVLQFDGRSVSTLVTLGWSNPDDMLVDQDGDLWFLNVPWLEKMPAAGGPRTTLVTGAPLMSCQLMEQELLSGDLILIGSQQPTAYLTRLDRHFNATSIKWPMPAMPGWHRNLHTDFTDGSMILTWGPDVMRLDTRTGSILSLYRSGKITCPVAGLDHDPFRGGFLNVEIGFLLRFDPFTRTQTTIFTIPGSTGSVLDQVACYGSRMLTGRNPARLGTTYIVDLAFCVGEAGQGYRAAAAFGPLRKIRVGHHWVPLDPDPLFFLSLTTPSIFEGFAGQLDSAGRAVLKVHFPNIPELAGARIFLAAISHDTSGIRMVSEPFGVTIG